MGNMSCRYYSASKEALLLFLVVVVVVCLQENIMSRLSFKPSPSLPVDVNDDTDTNDSELTVSTCQSFLCLAIKLLQLI